MKTKYYLLFATFLFSSCTIFSTPNHSEKPDSLSGLACKLQSITQIEVALLIIDYNTLEITGHKFLTYNKNYQDTFKLLPFDFKNYFAGDFGGFSCTVSNSKDTIVAGTIIWMGEGHLNFPKKLDSTSYKESQYFSLLTPKAFQYFNEYKEGSKQKTDYIEQTEQIFNKIKHLELLKKFSSNYKIGYYLYTPRIGKTDYRVAKWLVFLVRDI